MKTQKVLIGAVFAAFVLSTSSIAHAELKPTVVNPYLTVVSVKPNVATKTTVVQVMGRQFSPNTTILFFATDSKGYDFRVQPRTGFTGGFLQTFTIPYNDSVNVAAGISNNESQNAYVTVPATTKQGITSIPVTTPTKVRVFTGGADVAILWQPDPNAQLVKQYNVYRNGKFIAATFRNGSDPLELEYNGARYYDKNVVAGQTYKYQIATVGINGYVSPLSAPVSVVQPKNTTPVPKVVIDATAAPDLQTVLTSVAVPTLKTWYPKISDKLAYLEYKPASTITVRIGGQAGDIASTDYTTATINIAPDWLRQHRNAQGVYIHEGTHIVQAYAKDPGAFMTEGLADWSNAFMFHGRNDVIKPGDTYKDGYSPAADFMQWMITTYKMGNALREANIAAHNGTYSDSIFTSKAGDKTLDQLWAQFIKNPQYSA